MFRRVQRKPHWRKTAQKEVTQVNIRSILARYRSEGWVLYRLTQRQVDRAVADQRKQLADAEARQYISAIEKSRDEIFSVKKENERLAKELATLKREADQMRSHLNQERKHLLNSVLCSKHTIDEISSSLGFSGVYFLWQSDVIVYIGMSKNIGNRLRSHASEKMAFFDHFSFLRTKDDIEAANLERLFITNNDPKFNKTYKKNAGVSWLLNLKSGVYENEVA